MPSNNTLSFACLNCRSAAKKDCCNSRVNTRESDRRVTSFRSVVYQRHTEINYVRYRTRRLFIAARRQAGWRRKTVAWRRPCGYLSRLHQPPGSSSDRQVSTVYVRAAAGASDGVQKVGDGDERLQATVDVVCPGFCRRARQHHGVTVVLLQRRRHPLRRRQLPRS